MPWLAFVHCGCPYKKIYFNWKSGKSEKCSSVTHELSQANPPCAQKPAWSHPVSGRAALRRRPHRGSGGTEREVDLYERQCEVFLDPLIPQ